MSNESTPAKAGVSRRSFLKTSATAAAATGVTLAAPSIALGQSKSKKTLKIALIGVGAQGEVLLKAALGNKPGEGIENIQFVAVCDIWKDYRLKYGYRLMQKFGHTAKPYEDYKELISKHKDELDGAIVAVPDFMHAPVTIACLEAGINVYCEKCMSNTIEAAAEMVVAQKETGKLLQIGHQRRSNPRYLMAYRKLLYGADLTDRITAANAQWNRGVSEDLGFPAKYELSKETLAQYGYANMHEFRNWRWFKKYGGGPISDLGAHQIDIFNWFFGTNPVNMIAAGGVDYYENHEWYDNVMAIYEYETKRGPARAFYQVQTTTSAGGGNWEYFMGVGGALKISENPKWTRLFMEPKGDEEKWTLAERKKFIEKVKAPATAKTASATKVDLRESPPLASYYLNETLGTKAIHQPHIENFLDSIRGEATLNCPAEAGFATAVAVLKANEAVAAQTMLKFEDKEFTA